MKLAKGDLFSDVYADVVLVTTNAYIKSDGSLVMGRGAAAQLAKLHPTIPYAFGKLVKASYHYPHYGVVIESSPRDGRLYGAFQVKENWFDKASHMLIHQSMTHLYELAHLIPNWKFAMNFPGIGNGQLDRKDVLPTIELLPDNVEVWEF